MQSGIVQSSAIARVSRFTTLLISLPHRVNGVKIAVSKVARQASTVMFMHNSLIQAMVGENLQ
jgi:hypothetical protein